MSTFKTFEADDIVKANPTEVTTGLWPGDVGSLTAFYTGSQATGSVNGQYYWDVFDSDPFLTSSANTCFAVAYGHRTGGGGPTLNQDDSATLATQAEYSQYRNLLLDPGDTKFTFYGPYDSDQIYVINVYRSLIKERLDPGNWQLTLSGSNGTFTFIDDSGQSLGSAFGKSGLVFNVVSGSIGTGASGSTITTLTSSVNGGFGLFYPSLGVIVFNPDALVATVGFNGTAYTSGSTPFKPVTGSFVGTPQYNHAALYRSIKLGADFQARSAENISSTHYFLRLKSKEFNYSNNPTFYDETTGAVIQPAFIQDPRTYPTTFGLYNDNLELLAVGKATRPLPKGFDKEVNVKLRLDF